MISVFYQQVTLSPDQSLLLDGKPAHTQTNHVIRHTSCEVMQSIVTEWQSQARQIEWHTMPASRLLCALLDMTDDREAYYAKTLKAYAGNELLCYHADPQTALGQQQQQHWMPWIAWGTRYTGINWPVTHDITPVRLHQTDTVALSDWIEKQPPLALLCGYALISLLGSFILTTALIDDAITPDEATELAWLEHRVQMQQWGDDADLIQQQERCLAEVAAISHFHINAKT